MDPLKIFPEEVCERIFMYLSTNDIIESSLVSKHWYQMTGNSKECMKKIVLHHFSFQILNIQHFCESTRKYQHLHLAHDIYDVKKNSGIMRKIRTIVNQFAGSLKTLKTHFDIPRTCELTKLKELEISCSVYYQHKYCIEKTGLLSKAKHLEKLTLNCTDLCKNSIKAVQKIIKDIDSLKFLTIKDSYILDGLNNAKFKLQEFRLAGCSYIDWIPSYYEFFNAQKPYLKTVDCIMSFKQIAFFMENFPTLEKLVARNDTFEDAGKMEELMGLDTLPYPIHDKITTFGYDGFVFNGEINNLCSIMSKLTNLQKLMLNFIDPTITSSILNLKSVKTVEYCNVDNFLLATSRRQIKQNVKNAKCKYIRVKDF